MFGPHCSALPLAVPEGGQVFVDKGVDKRDFLQLFPIVFYCARAVEPIHAYPRARWHAWEQDAPGSARPFALSVACTASQERLAGVGVSKSTSGKFYARILLNGTRYNLGSTYETPEEASAAYESAKRDGSTERRSPRRNRNPRGTGMPHCHPPH